MRENILKTTYGLFLGVFLLLITVFSFPADIAAKEGYITGSNLNVRSEPSLSSNVVGKLQLGDKVEIIKTSGDWVQIKFNNQTAYVHKDYINSGQQQVTVHVNGKKLNLPIEPQIKNDRTLVPFRVIGESLGIEVTWLPKTRQVKAVDEGKEVVFTINSPIVKVNNKDVKVDPSPYIYKDHTVIPLRFFAEEFGANVGWDSKARMVTVSRSREPQEGNGTKNPPSKPVEKPDPIVPAPPKPEVPSNELQGQFVVINNSIDIYESPLGTKSIKTLSFGDPVKVIAIENENWYQVEVDGKTGYAFRQDIGDLAIDGIVGEVHSTSLNVRSGPGSNFPEIGKFTQGQKVTIYAFDKQWAKVKVGNQWGYAHAYYLKLFKDGINYAQLKNPRIEQSNDRDILVWDKLGPVVTEHRLTANGVDITTNVNIVEKLNVTHPGIKDISYTKVGSSTKVSITLNDGYRYIANVTIDELELKILPGGLQGKRIVIDAGHGNQDPGAIGITGLKEKEFNLAVALKVKSMLEEQGAIPVLTRQDDTFLSLSERVNVAANQDADAFISIHADSFNSTSQGSTSFYHSGNPSWEQSKQLSDIMIKKITAKMGTKSRGSVEKSLHVIRETKIPAILLEAGFLSNAAEEAKLKSDEYRQKSAEAIVETLIEFYN